LLPRARLPPALPFGKGGRGSQPRHHLVSCWSLGRGKSRTRLEPALVGTRSVQLCGRVLCKDLCGIIVSLLFRARRCSEGVSCATRLTLPGALGRTARGLRTGGRARHSCFHLLYLPTDGPSALERNPVSAADPPLGGEAGGTRWGLEGAGPCHGKALVAVTVVGDLGAAAPLRQRRHGLYAGAGTQRHTRTEGHGRDTWCSARRRARSLFSLGQDLAVGGPSNPVLPSSHRDPARSGAADPILRFRSQSGVPRCRPAF